MTVSETAGPGCSRIPGDPGPDGGRPSRHATRSRGPAGVVAAVCLWVGLAGAPGAARADVALATVAKDTLVVRGRSVADGVLPAAPGVVTVVDLDDEPAGGDLGRLLARVAGLQVRRYGGLGAESVASVRGSSAAQVMVLVDGLPLADAQRGAADLSLLPLDRYGAAEIHRGVVPAGFGGIGAAGAINLRTADRAAGPDARLFAGSFGDLGGRISQGFSGGEGTRRGLVLAHGRSIDNRYEYLDHNQTFHDPDDDAVRTRENADFDEWGAMGQGEVRGRAGLARVAAGYFRRDGGRPGPISYPSPDARIRHERADARVGVSGLDGTLTLDVAAARREDRLYDPLREVGLDPYDVTQAVSEDLVGRAVWTPHWDLGDVFGLGLAAGGDARRQWYRETNDGVEDPLRNRRTVSAFAGAALEWFGPRLSLRPAWRWQRIRDDFPPVPDLPWLPEQEGVVHQQDAVSPSLGLGWQVVPDRLSLQVHWFDAVRQPTWVELFGQPGGLAGNRDLVPEEIHGRDLGLRWTPATGAALRVTAFRHDTDRTIIYYWAGLGVSRPANIGRSTNHGIEVEGHLQRGPVELAGNVTWQQPRDDGGLDPTYDGKALPYLSDWDAFLDLRWRLGAWRPGVSVFYQSANYRTRYNREIDRAPERTLANLFLAFDWGRSTITGEVLNLTDNSVYDVEGYPLPGRSARVVWHWH